MPNLNRRDFVKFMGLAGTSVTIGCSDDSARKLIPYIIPPEDIIPGEATWYATTCRECPAGCGMLAKNRDGRIIKVEGNPAHPVNHGVLCARGHASLHGLYNPDRFEGPMRKEGEKFVSLPWPAAIGNLATRLKTIYRKGRGERIVFMSTLSGPSMEELIGTWLAALGGGLHVIYEPFAYEPLRAANRIVYGEDTIPSYRIDEADFLISFGAGFLETWLSNVEYARQFAAFHESREERKNFFVHVAPRKSMTAASADLHLLVSPGGELAVAISLLHMLLEDARKGTFHIDPEIQRVLQKTLGSSSWAKDSGGLDMSSDIIRKIADRFMRAERPLVLAAGLPHSGPNETATAVAANLLCLLKQGSREIIDFRSTSAIGRAASAVAMKELSERMAKGDVDLLLLHDANPVFTLPSSWNFQENLRKVETIVSFSACPDETTSFAHFVLPTHTPLESWGDYSPRKGTTGLMQPVMGPVFNTMHLGDLLLEIGKISGIGEKLKWPDFYSILRNRWRERSWKAESTLSFESLWSQVMQQGGDWDSRGRNFSPPSLAADFNYSFPASKSVSEKKKGYPLVIYPTIQFFDGRMANRPWLQELPDPVTQTTWGGWVEMHTSTAAELQVGKGDVIRITTLHGAIEVPVLPIDTVPQGVLALPIGQGHEANGRYADGLPGNPLLLFPPGIDPLSGGIEMAPPAEVIKLNRQYPIANTDGSYSEHGRNLVRVETLGSYHQAVAAGEKNSVDLPLPQGFDPVKDFYPPHSHAEYRWCMVIDLDRCIGCGACVVACSAENNVAIVGREQVLKGREMSWLRIQRYFSDDGTSIRYLPMLCQHCDAAPCESVCPVFAPHHGAEGLNNQVYNRCIGTRFCSQNDPYKVRRFNWFTFTRPSPLDWQLNPDVTVRQKGVMEKCSFCVQRITKAKLKARKKGRKVADGEFTAACAQTCPVEALTFGNLKDPGSRVAQLIKDPRAYQVLGNLNTKPAVIYLKKLTQEL